MLTEYSPCERRPGRFRSLGTCHREFYPFCGAGGVTGVGVTLTWGVAVVCWCCQRLFHHVFT